MDLFMLFFAVGWGLACFVAGAFAGWMYARAAGNQVSEIDLAEIAEAKWKEAETLLEHLLEVTQATASELGNHHEQVDASMQRLSETLAESQAEREPTQSMADAVFGANERLEARFEQVMRMLQETAPVDSPPTGTSNVADGRAAPADAAPPNPEDHQDVNRPTPLDDSENPGSDAEIRERLEGANCESKRLARRQPRVQFKEMHDIAPIVGHAPPSPDDYMKVSCRDISSAGFSFYFPSEVPWERIVLRTTHGSKVREMTADVVHCSRTAKPTAPAPFIVGCRFTGPLKRLVETNGTERVVRTTDARDASALV